MRCLLVFLYLQPCYHHAAGGQLLVQSGSRAVFQLLRVGLGNLPLDGSLGDNCIER